MRYANSIGACFLFGALIAGGVPGLAETDGNGFVRVTTGQLTWLPFPMSDGVEFAILFGDPTKAGDPYVIRVKFPPWKFDNPHYHPEGRHVTVLKGTWYTGTGDALDLSKAVPLKVGDYMFHPAKAVHWDGAKDEEVIVEITGVGPAPSIVAKPGDPLFFSIEK
jgi:quercetin dioxygenase-like cupin family protein